MDEVLDFSVFFKLESTSGDIGDLCLTLHVRNSDPIEQSLNQSIVLGASFSQSWDMGILPSAISRFARLPLSLGSVPIDVNVLAIIVVGHMRSESSVHAVVDNKIGIFWHVIVHVTKRKINNALFLTQNVNMEWRIVHLKSSQKSSHCIDSLSIASTQKRSFKCLSYP